jgi:hypothetical protein
MQRSAVDIRGNILGLQREKKEFKHDIDWLSESIWQCPT